MEIKREIRVAVNTGKVDFGLKEAYKNLEDDDCDLLIVASNCPDDQMKENDEFEGVSIYHFEGNNQVLGSAAGKPFAISIMSILDSGESNILSLKAE
ncbi:MAG: 50S ribosomal protein L30e [Candidatus Thermoplasmatota archaeon]|nr:50S ribosomal protein L30e [Candidatus Thermoplasmatota archaeon]